MERGVCTIVDNHNTRVNTALGLEPATKVRGAGRAWGPADGGRMGGGRAGGAAAAGLACPGTGWPAGAVRAQMARVADGHGPLQVPSTPPEEKPRLVQLPPASLARLRPPRPPPPAPPASPPLSPAPPRPPKARMLPTSPPPHVVVSAASATNATNATSAAINSTLLIGKKNAAGPAAAAGLGLLLACQLLAAALLL